MSISDSWDNAIQSARDALKDFDAGVLSSDEETFVDTQLPAYFGVQAPGPTCNPQLIVQGAERPQVVAVTVPPAGRSSDEPIMVETHVDPACKVCGSTNSAEAWFLSTVRCFIRGRKERSCDY